MTLAELIQRRRQQILDRFVEALYERGAAKGLTREEVQNNAGPFIDELARALEDPGTTREVLADAAANHPAAAHGRQRHDLGYDLGALIREYLILHDVLHEELRAVGATPTTEEMFLLSRHLMAGIVAGATTFGKDRETAQRQAAERHVAFLAHELRNPLASVRLAVEILQRRGEVNKETPAFKTVLRGINQLREQIDGALIEVRLRSQGKAARDPVDLVQLIHRLAEDWAPEVESRELSLAIEVQSPLVMQADPRLLRSVLGNLVHNAVKFSKPGGDLHVRARLGEGRVIIEVEDACGGISKEDVEKVFDPFVQVGQDRSGFGLGLAIAKQATTAHEGELRVHSLPGKGCVFVLDLPVERHTPPDV